MQYCLTAADSDCFLWEGISASFFINGQDQFFCTEISIDRYKSVRLELRLRIGSRIPTGMHVWIHMHSRLFLQKRELS